MKATSHPKPSVWNVLFTIFFWIFNSTLLVVLYLGLTPFWGIPLLVDAVSGQVPLNLALTFVGLVGVPTSCAIAGALPKQRQAVSLFQLFYGVEAPLLTLCLVRFFWLRDLTPASSLLLVTGAVCTVAFAHWLALQRDGLGAGNWWHLLCSSLLLTISLYLMAISLFYVPPFLAAVLVGMPVMIIYLMVLLPIGLLLGGLLTLPFGMAIVYFQTCRALSSQLGGQMGVARTRAIALSVVGAWLVAIALLQQQPQVEAFRLLDQTPQTDQERQTLLNQSETIRKGLLNAYLAPYRYPRFEETGVKDIYQYNLGMPVESAQLLQDAYNWVTAPFLYRGDRSDMDKAAALYAGFFDTPILRGEYAAVQKALQSTFDRGAAKAGLDDINRERVWLAEQQITVKPEGDWAEVELYEVYENQTFDLEEVLYYFSLPESAAITGIWLSDKLDQPKKYPFVIASRGAAQQVYTQEVQRNVDPALLEQVGPRSYRLRAFPVPGKGSGKLYLWLSYRVLKQEQGWPMPQLSERRNVFWSGATKRTVNGQSVRAQDAWVPEAIPANSAQAARQSHQMSLPWGANLLAMPFTEKDYQLPRDKRFALVIDGSYSMRSHRQELAKTLDWLKQNVLNQNTADVYLTAAGSEPRQIENLNQFDAQKALFYGSLQPGQMLQQFQQSSSGEKYDAVLLMTDPGSYELTEDNKTALKLPAPLWLVHLGGPQAAYDDATLQAIQDSGGGVSTQVQEVMQRIATRPSRGEGTSLLNVVDGYAWYLVQQAARSSTAEGFTPLAARQWVTHLSRYVKPDALQQLDTIHAVTQQYGIVSPYSSMIVLVNDQQREDLKRAEQGSDRFQREVEDQQLPQPASPGLVAVPEPAEWLLLLLVVVGLVAVYRPRQPEQLN